MLRKFGLQHRSRTKERLELENLKEQVREDDIVVVWKLDRLGRSLKDLLNIVNEFRKLGVEFKSLNDNIDTSTTSGRLFFNIIGSLAEYEREMIVERTKAGLESARLRGRIGGRKKGLNQDAKNKAAAAKHLYEENKISVSEILTTLSISKATLYHYLNYMGVKIGRSIS